MNIIDNNCDKNSKSKQKQKILFDYNSRVLWPEEDVEVDMDYVPQPPQISDESSNSAIEDINDIIGPQTADNLPESVEPLEDNNGLTDDRIVAPIKISKNKRKNSKNWSIVGQKPTKNKQNNGVSGDICPKDFGPKRKGRKPKATTNGFKVTEDTPHKPPPKKAKKSPTKETKSERKRVERDYSKQKSPKEPKDRKMETFWQFNCLLSKVAEDFHQILPNEILIKIFNIVLEKEINRTESMINLSRVCESWRKIITTTPLLWQSLDLQTFSDAGFPYNDLFQLLEEHQLFNHLRSLNLNGWSGANAERIIEKIVTNCGHNLYEISLKNCKNIFADFLQSLSTYCTNLQILDISGITFRRFSIFRDYIHIGFRRRKAASHQTNQSPFGTSVFRPFIEKCGPNLLSLKISENTMPSFHSCISSIMEFCPNLELLDISNVESLTKSASISVEKLQTSCPKLRVLRAANITFTSSTSGSQTDGFTSLEELSIPFNADFSTQIIQNAHTDNVLEQLTKNAEHLKLIDIRGARYLSHRALVKIPAWNIQHLSVSNCPKLMTEQLEMAFTKWSKSLIDVDISWNTSEESVNSCMKSLCEVGEQESQLRTLQLRGSAVSYESIKSLFRSCPKLESIDLQSCRGLPRGIKRAYSGSELLSLKTEVFEGKYD